MRRNDREIKNFDDIVSVMEKCGICRLAIHDEEFPYILPLNFGMRAADRRITLYFHGALKGKKYELLAKNNKVGFEMDCSHRLVTNADEGKCTMEYESVIGQGIIDMVPEDEKLEALDILMAHYPVDKSFKYNMSFVPATAVMKLTVQSLTGKRLMVK